VEKSQGLDVVRRLDGTISALANFLDCFWDNVAEIWFMFCRFSVTYVADDDHRGFSTVQLFDTFYVDVFRIKHEFLRYHFIQCSSRLYCNICT
jgi:hypothetical protein